MAEPFKSIYGRAVKRKGKRALEDSLPKPKSRGALERLDDGEILSEMGKAIFRAGFSWRVVDQKWPAFLELFHGFEPKRVAELSARDLDVFAEDKRLIRHRAKLVSLRDNAAYCVSLAAEHGSAAKFLAGWPVEEITGLWLALKSGGSSLGGATGARVLRTLGKDTFVFTPDVLKGMKKARVALPSASSKTGLAKAQKAFNGWRAESGLPLCAISSVLARSVD